MYENPTGLSSVKFVSIVSPVKSPSSTGQTPSKVMDEKCRVTRGILHPLLSLVTQPVFKFFPHHPAVCS